MMRMPVIWSLVGQKRQEVRSFGIEVAVAVTIVLLFDTDPDCNPDSDADSDGSRFTAIFGTVLHAPWGAPTLMKTAFLPEAPASSPPDTSSSLVRFDIHHSTFGRKPRIQRVLCANFAFRCISSFEKARTLLH
jgi:hypothetical protein